MASPTGIRKRHSTTCPAREGGACRCDQGYEAFVYSPRDGRKIRKTFATVGEAKRWRTQGMAASSRGALRVPTRRTFREEAEEWERKAEVGERFTRSGKPYKASVIRLVAADCRNYLEPAFGSARLGEITRRDVQGLVDRLRAERDDKGEPKHSGSKIRSVVTSLKIILRRALEDEELAIDPTRPLRLPPAGEPRDWDGTPERVAALLASLPVDLRPLYATAAYAGLRRGELLALRWENVHGLGDEDSDRWIEVAEDGNWDTVDGRVAPKSASGVRVVPIPETLRGFLLTHRKRTGRSGSALVYGRTASQVLDPKGVQARADKAFATAEVERVTLHELRHAYRSFLGDCGIPEERCDRYLGHSSARASRIGRSYSHRIAGQLAADAATLEAYLTGEAASVTVLRPWRNREAEAAVLGI